MVKKVGKTTDGKELTKKTYQRGSHPASLANLQKWPEGMSGNPAGPPRRKKLLQDAFKEKLEEIIEEEGSRKGQRIAQALADLSWEWVKKAKTVSEFSSLLSQIRETAGERAIQKDDMSAITANNVIFLPKKSEPVPMEAQVIEKSSEETTYEAIDYSDEN